MATYYVRIGGDDANNGTSPATAWKTWGKALGTTGIASGDVLYIGAGLYNEAVTIAMTSPTVTTRIIGDVTGAYTGDPGDVVFSNSWTSTHAGNILGSGLSFSGRDYLSFENISFHFTSSNNTDGINLNSTAKNNSFVNCTFYHDAWGANGPGLFWIDSAIDANLVFEGCRFWFRGLVFNCALGSVDYNINCIVKNCIFYFCETGVLVRTSGTGTVAGNGVSVSNCSFIGSNVAVQVLNTQNSTANPTLVQNCLGFVSASALQAGTSGQITDQGGNRFINWSSLTTTNVTQHVTSQFGSGPNIFPLEFGQMGHLANSSQPLIHPFQPYPSRNGFPVGLFWSSPASGGSTTDINGMLEAGNQGQFGSIGTATASTTSSISDSSKAWMTNYWRGWLVRTTGGTGSGQVKRISSNTNVRLDITGSGLWATTPDTTTTYVVYQGPMVQTGKATSGTTTTLVDSGATWFTNQWRGFSCEITAGTNTGQVLTVSSNTGTTLTFSTTLGTAIDNTSVYALYAPGKSLTAPVEIPGALTMGRTATVAQLNATENALTIAGPGEFDVVVAVPRSPTILSVKMRYDSNHGTTNKPQMILLAAPELGVVTETKTMTGNADVWEVVSTTRFTPSAAGFVTVRLKSRSAVPYGRAFFEQIEVD